VSSWQLRDQAEHRLVDHTSHTQLQRQLKTFLFRPNWSTFHYWLCKGLQCFDTVGWVAGRASGLYKTKRWGAGMVICLELGADLHMDQLMPLPLTVSCFSKIQTGFAFLVPAHLGSPGKRGVKRVCVYWLCKGPLQHLHDSVTEICTPSQNCHAAWQFCKGGRVRFIPACF